METKRLLIAAIALSVASAGGFFLFQANQHLLEYADREYREMQQSSHSPMTSNEQSEGAGEQSVRWVYGKNNWWMPQGELPRDCPENMVLDPPTDLSLATAVLYPGQWRGDRERSDNYKPHGGLRFDGLAVDEVSVSMPATADLVQMAQYLAAGEIQYTLEFITPCGLVMRLGHLRALTPRLSEIAATLPPAREGDSRTHAVGPLRLERGEEVAVATGLTGPGSSPGRDNTFVDWGVYRTDRKNRASEDPAWAAAHPTPYEQYAVCWFDYLSETNATIVRSLPTGSEGTISDYCN